MATVSCQSMDDVISFAISKEESAMEFYRKCAERAKNPGIKTFFQEMVEEEARHRDMLKGLDIAHLEGIKLERVEDLQISDYLIDVKFREELTYQEALTLAMKREEKAHAFYESWKGRCMHEKTAKVFELLAQEEMKHKRKIETIYDEEILTWD
ncbi:MAG: ferritin-like domain-containing protein [Acidobacteriota bacterium]